MKTSNVGYPRIGSLRELKFAIEKYFRKDITEEELHALAKNLRKKHWEAQKGIDFIPSNDFSYYDTMLDTAVLFNVIPQRYLDLHVSQLERYFAMARGYQGEQGDVKALAMKKWFNTNYHYMVPELDDDTHIHLQGKKLFDEYKEAKALGIETKPVLIGPFTFLKLARYKGKKDANAFTEEFIKAYCDVLKELNVLHVTWLQVDEPYLVHDLTKEDISLFKILYEGILSKKGDVKVLLQTYFGDIRDVYVDVQSLAIDGVGIDFVEGKESLNLIKTNGFPNNKYLFAGLVNGKNIWRNNYENTLHEINELQRYTKNVVLSTSCSLLHVPYTIENESKLDASYKQHFAFAKEKIHELQALKEIINQKNTLLLDENRALFKGQRNGYDQEVKNRLDSLTQTDFTRFPNFEEREEIQRKAFKLPLFPTTTIGSFPQTKELKAIRSKYKRHELSEADYDTFIKEKIDTCIHLQEQMDIDVLVHGEFERNDMVEYFGEHLQGFLFTEKAWVQSYGTRCVKPPIIWGDIARHEALSIEHTCYAQSLSNRPVKGMLTGPVTILNWSFPRVDITVREAALQIALAIRDEVLDLESHGIKIIQIDEAALREKLPLRKSDWHSEYLDWAIPAFRLVHSGVQPQTQIHTHMCYSEFEDIIQDIDDMDADVISFEASRSDLTIIDALSRNNFKTQVGPGVYDIHSPRVPSVEELHIALQGMLQKIRKEKLWINPDCGLKTRGDEESIASLENMVCVAKQFRNNFSE